MNIIIYITYNSPRLDTTNGECQMAKTVKITKCKDDPRLNPKNRLYVLQPSNRVNYQYPKDFADYHRKVGDVYVGTDVVSHFPKMAEAEMMNASMKELACYNHGIKPQMEMDNAKAKLQAELDSLDILM